ncbi:MAG: hypothetical protein ACKO38_10675 [Planctomycetota bacterium]
MSSLKESGAATVDELRQFLDTMRGKSAKEVLGKIAESGLIKAVVQATVASFVLIGVFTVGPYVMQGKKEASSSTAAGKTGAEKSADGKSADSAADGKSAAASVAGGPAGAANASTAGDAGAGGSAASGDNASGGPGGDLERAAKMMGVGDTKAADPKANPRERDLDNLLDKIK